MNSYYSPEADEALTRIERGSSNTLTAEVNRVLDAINENPFDPRLVTRSFSGTLGDLARVTRVRGPGLTEDWCIVWCVRSLGSEPWIEIVAIVPWNVD